MKCSASSMAGCMGSAKYSAPNSEYGLHGDGPAEGGQYIEAASRLQAS